MAKTLVKKGPMVDAYYSGGKPFFTRCFIILYYPACNVIAVEATNQLPILFYPLSIFNKGASGSPPSFRYTSLLMHATWVKEMTAAGSRKKCVRM